MKNICVFKIFGFIKTYLCHISETSKRIFQRAFILFIVTQKTLAFICKLFCDTNYLSFFRFTFAKITDMI